MRTFLGRWSLAVVLVLAAGPAARAANRVKANNTSNLNLTVSWTGGVVPGANDLAIWTNTVTAANDVLLGSNLSFGGIAIFNPGGAVSIGGSDALTLGVFGVDLGRANQALTLAPAELALATNASVSLNVTNGLVLTVNPTNFSRPAGAVLAITNAGTVATATITNDATGIVGTWARHGAGTATRYATVSGGVLTGYAGVAAATAADVVDAGGTTNYDVAADGVLGAGASFNTLRYAGAAGGLGGNFSANGLLNAGAGAVVFSNGVTIGAGRELVILSPDTTRAITVAGSVVDNGAGASGLTISGGGRVNLSASNAYSGVTVVNAGILAITNARALGTTDGNTVVHSSGSIGLNGGQLALSGGVTIDEPIVIQGPGDGTFGSFNGAVSSSSGTNSVTGTVTLTGTASYRMSATAPGAVLNLGLVQRSAAGGGNLILDPVVGATVNVNTAIDNNAGQLTCHAGGTVVLNASGNDLGFAVAQNATTLKITAPDALATNQSLQLGQSSGANGASGVNNDVGTFMLEGVNQTLNALIGSTNSGANATTTDKRKITSTATNAMTLTIGNGNGSGTFDGVIENGTNGGTIALTKVGSGTQTLAGSRANTFSGLTTVNGGTLNLNKLAGTNAVGGHLLVGAGILAHQRGDQIPDAAGVTMAATNAQWNLGGFTETIANLDMQNAGPIVNVGFLTGVAGKLTVTGTLTHTLGNITLNSGGTGQSFISADSVVNMGGSWIFGISSGTQYLNIASGGLTIGGGSTILVDATTANPNFINLNGDVGSLTNAASNVISGAGQLRLNNTRVFTVADGAAANDLVISAIIADGTNTGSLVKEGPGTLVLSGVNAYSGTSAINAGALDIGGTNALPGWDTTGRYSVAGGAALIVANAVGDAAIGTMLGTGNFAAGASLGFDTASGNRTYAPGIADTGAGMLGLIKVGTNTLTLAGTNTYTGMTFINAGVLSIASTNALPGWDTNGRYVVASNATLAAGTAVSNASVAAMLATTNFAAGANIGFDTSAGSRPYGNAIQNSANGVLGLVKIGTNTLTISGTNSYDGVTAISVGTLLINHANALGTTNGNTVINCTGGTANGGQLMLSGGITLAEPILFSGVGDGSPYIQSLQVAGGGGTNTLTGAITLATLGSARMTAGGAGTVLNLNAPIRRTNNASGLILGANGSGGMVVVNNIISNNGGGLTFHNGPGTILFNTTGHSIGDTSVQYTHLLKLGISDAIATNRNLVLGANPVNTDPSAERGSFDMAGFNQTINALIGNGTNPAAHPATRAVSNSAAGQSKLTVGNGNGSGTFNGVILGNIALTKVGTGIQTLTGTNTYTGATTINAGTLALTGNCALVSSTIVVGAGASLSVTGRVDGTLSIAAGQTLTGSGTILGTAITDGTVAPGQSAGTLSVSGDFVQLSGALAFELGGTNAGTQHDLLNIAGNGAFMGGLTVSLIDNFIPVGGDSFTIVQSAGLVGPFSSVTYPVVPGIGWDTAYLASTVVLSATGFPSGYLGYAVQITNRSLRGITADADGDGFANLLEYVTGASPTNADTVALLSGARTNGVLALQFTRDTNSVDATLIVEASYGASDSSEWTGIATNAAGLWAGPATVLETGAGNPVTATVQDTDPSATNRFLRLRITHP